MNYTGQKCSVCNLEFKEDDDVVVCAVCGTPHHRECYDKNHECANEQKHKDNYDWIKEHRPKEENKCKKCGFENGEDILFCGKCGNPLNGNTENSQNRQQPPIGNPFFTQNNNGTTQFTIDPLAGISPETEFDDNVTAQDLADVTKVNTFYYMNVFNRIKSIGTSRFNLASFFFNSLWWIYRKMYVTGICLFLFTFISSLITIYLFPTAIDLINQLGANPSQELIYEFAQTLSTEEMVALFLPGLLNIINMIIMFVSGFIGNRTYYKHCKKQIKKIKSEEKATTKIKEKLNSVGGTNYKLTLGFGICLLIISVAQNFM